MESANKKGIALPALTALVISSAIGAGIYDLPSTLAENATPGVALLAWGITGFGILMLALCLNYLVLHKPQLNGIADYARDGFGDFAGFISGWGYWLSAWLGNVAFATMMMSAVGFFIPSFRSGNSVKAIIVASLISWILTFVVTRGIESAAIINLVVTICKMIPLFSFIVIAIMSFRMGVFTAHFWENVAVNLDTGHVQYAPTTLGGIGKQIQGSIMAMMWVFVGMEGATMMADRAKRKSDAGRATIIGLLSLLAIYIVVSVLPYGYMTQSEIVKLPHPTVVYLFERMVGPAGGALISIGLMISILGAWLSWTMLPVEATQLMADKGLLPGWFGVLNKHNTPYHSLWLTQILMQMFIITLIFTNQAYNFAYSLCTSAIIVCYALVGAYMIKLGIERKAVGVFLLGFFATSFEVISVAFSGLQFLWLTTIVYVLGFAFYLTARHHTGRTIRKIEWICMAVITVLAIAAVVALSMGKIVV